MGNTNGGQSNFVVYPSNTLNFYLPDPYSYAADTYYYRHPLRGYAFFQMLLAGTVTIVDNYFLVKFVKVSQVVNGSTVLSWVQTI